MKLSMRALRVGLVASASLLTAAAGQAGAQIIQFDLIGRAGSGLLAGNENFTVNGTFGSGGEIGQGIFFNAATNQLTINVGWGSANGFSNLTGNATVGHIHGPTTSAAPASFTQSAGVKYGLDNLAGWNPSASAGSFIGTISILPADVQGLYDGKFYINVHTSLNGPGEIRGQLVPAPGAAGLLLGSGLLAARRRRR